jgi:HK97 family phage portal protein
MAKSKTANPFSRAIGRLLKRNASHSGDTSWLASRLLAFQQTKSGQNVSIDNALQATAVLACTRVIAEDVGQVPFVVKKRSAKGARWIADEDHWLTTLLRTPNEWMTQFEFMQMVTAHAALGGDGYAFINRGINSGRAKELLPFPTGAVTPEWVNGWGVQYRVTWKDGRSEIIPRENMLRLRGLPWHPLYSSAPFQMAREAIGISLATESSHASLHRNGVRLSGILTTGPQAAALSEPAAARIATQWKQEFGPNATNEFGVAVLEGGMKFESMSMSGVDAQHLETRAFQVEECCRAMRVYPQKIGHSSKASTFASTSEMNLAHDSDTVSPWALRWSQLVEKMFVPRSSEPNTWASFDVYGLRRGDPKSRASYYNSGINSGWLSRNEARALEGLEEKDGLDEFLTPVQLAPGNSADATNAKNEQVSQDEALGA